MDVHVSHLQFWYANCQSLSVQDALENTNLDHDWPKLEFVPAMQRRRLSAFAKMSLFVADKTMQHTEERLPIIFSSRHGDLHKTADLLDALTTDSPLSPTAFSLSVHNAIPSLYSILTQNKQAINAISAQKDSLYMSIVDAYARLSSGVANKILLIHADQRLPETYKGFRDELQLSHAVSMIISLPTSDISKNGFNITLDMLHQPTDDLNTIPAAFLFAQWYQSNSAQLCFNSNQYQWTVSKNVLSN